MKIAAIVALNALVVGAGILAYDVMRAVPDPAPAATKSADLSPVLDRLEALERRLDGIDTSGERRLSTRLLQLEQRVGSMDAGGAAAVVAVAAGEIPGSSAETAAIASTDVAPDLGDGPDEREIARVREALEQVEAERDRKRAGRMAEGLVDRLDLSLTDEQRERLGAELGTFRETMREHFRASMAAGLTREEMRAGLDEKRGELTETLSTFLAASDAEAIAAEIGSGPRGGPGGGRGFGGGGGPGR